MNLQPVTGRPFSCQCVACPTRGMAGDNTTGTTFYADLDGKAWRDYYCALCAGEVRRLARDARALGYADALTAHAKGQL